MGVRRPFHSAGFAALAVAGVCTLLGVFATTPAAAQVLSNSVPTVDFERPDTYTPMTVAYHPGFDLYYAQTGGTSTRPCYVYDPAGNWLQTAPLGFSVRSVYYNPNTNQMECATFNAVSGGTNNGLMHVILDANGMQTGNSTVLLSSVPGLHASQTMPSYNPTLDVLYSHTDSASNGREIRIADRQTGQLTGTITLTGGTLTSWVSNWIGFDVDQQVFVHWDHAARMARVFDIQGQYIGSSAVSGVGSPNVTYGAGYANGQLFVFDNNTSHWEGHQILSDADIELQRPQGTAISHAGLDVLTQTLVAGTPESLTYTIENNGSAPLDLTGTPLVQFDNEDNCAVSLTQLPATPVGTGLTTTFTIEIVAQRAGPVSFDLLVPNTVAGKSPYLVTVQADAIAPSIRLARQGQPVWPGQNDSIGGHSSGTISVAYTISNVGGTELVVTGVTLANPGNVSAAITTQPAPTVPTGDSTSFTLELNPAATGPFGVDVTVESDDPDIGSYTIRLTGESQQPSYPVLRLTGIGSVPLTSDDHLGALLTAEPTDFTYTVHNDGAATLVIDSVDVANALNADVTLVDAPSTVEPQESASLTLSLTAPADGPVAFALQVDCNDPLHDPFVLQVEAEALAAAETQMAVWHDGAWLESGEPHTVDLAAAGNVVYLPYLVASIGSAPLDLTLPVEVTSTTNCSVLVLEQPAATLPAHGGHGVLLLRVEIETDAAASFSVSLTNSGSQANPFVLTGNFLFQVPRLEVRYPEFHALPNGSLYHLGVSTTAVHELTLHLANTGDAPLTLTAAPTLANVAFTEAELGTLASMTIPPGDTLSLEFSLNPMHSETFRLDLLVESDNAFGTSPYVVTFTGRRTQSISTVGRGCAANPRQSAFTWLLLSAGLLLLLLATRRATSHT